MHGDGAWRAGQDAWYGSFVVTTLPSHLSCTTQMGPKPLVTQCLRSILPQPPRTIRMRLYYLHVLLLGAFSCCLSPFSYCGMFLRHFQQVLIFSILELEAQEGVFHSLTIMGDPGDIFRPSFQGSYPGE